MLRCRFEMPDASSVFRYQRFWRLASLYLEIIYNVVVKTWDQVQSAIRLCAQYVMCSTDIRTHLARHVRY